ncbi:uncharacterized protein LOC128782266 [Vidua chalybeata]|uniref:uncharacterized protein LOC128782266 n=1 Tax=Vidua chalybeata TaxID=81927 RepID=UPI0023A8ABBC|nr:uncharacterized protein LOC128782266 [Vidua chalybeata]
MPIQERTVAEGQGFLKRNIWLEKCIRASHETNSVSLASCKEHSQQQRWGWDPDTGTIISLHMKRCTSTLWSSWSPVETGNSLGFHLGTKEGGHKVFVSREKDKFSRWKTLADETICAAAQTAAQKPSKPTQQALDTRVWIYETKTIDSSKIDAVDRESSVSLTDPPLANKFNSTVSPAKTKQAHFPANEDPSHNQSKKHGNRGKNTGARLAGTNWKTAMLVLSPLAFILGLIILTLNVHYNKKKKILSALKSPPDNSSRVDLREPTPLRRGPQLYLPPSRSPSLRHGEILIEWKDGTVTPLFDNINYQVD